jgi:hypothetical protein
MITQLKQQDIDLWEAWIEYDQFNPEHFGTLYVVGDILTDQKQTEVILKKKNDDEGKQLILEIPERQIGRKRMREASYSEPIEDLNQYTSICIYSGTDLVARFDEIEVLI